MRFVGIAALAMTAVYAQNTCNTTLQTFIETVSNNSASCKISNPTAFCQNDACKAITTLGKEVIDQNCAKNSLADIKFIFPKMCSEAACGKLVSQFSTLYADCISKPPTVGGSASCQPCRSLNDTAFRSSLVSICGYAAPAFETVLTDKKIADSFVLCEAFKSTPNATPKEDSGNNATIFVIIGIACAVLIILGAVIYKLKLKNDIAKRDMDDINNDLMGNEATFPGEQPKYTGGADIGRIANDIRFDEELAQFRIPQNEIQNVSLLVKGGYGVVFHASFGKDEVAMKQLLPSKSKDYGAIQEFMNEIRLCARLEHPKIVKFIGISWSTLHDLAVLSEFMPRGDVSTFLKKELKKSEANRIQWGPTDRAPTTKAKIAADIADALVYLHSFQPTIIHRDLKSKNVLLSETWEAKLSDFGISRVTSLEETMTSNIGTVAWIAPEVLSGGRYTEKADIYSFGVLLAELDTFEAPYTHLMNKSKDVSFSNARIALMVSEGSLKPEFTERMPEDLLNLAMECLAFNENNRPTAMALSYKIHTLAKNFDKTKSERGFDYS